MLALFLRPGRSPHLSPHCPPRSLWKPLLVPHTVFFFHFRPPIPPHPTGADRAHASRGALSWGASSPCAIPHQPARRPPPPSPSSREGEAAVEGLELLSAAQRCSALLGCRSLPLAAIWLPGSCVALQ